MFIFIPHNTAYCSQTDMFAMAIATFYLHNRYKFAIRCHAFRTRLRK